MSTILNGITLVIALLPTIVIMALVLSNARYKREPFKKIASVFGISALSTIPAGIMELIGMGILYLVTMLFGIDVYDTFGRTVYEFLQFMLVVGVVEEGCKYFTFKWMIFHDRDFDNTYDGVIYGAASALGFATLENLMYVFMDNDEALATAAMRALLSVPLHAVTGIVMGYWFGISKYRRYNNVQPVMYPERKAFIFSVILHGTYDFIVTLPEIFEDNSAVEAGSMIVLIGIMVFIYILIGKTIKRAKAETHNIYNRYYYEQLDGHWQDMFGGKTSEKRRMIFGMPMPVFYNRSYQGFDPYNPYKGMNLSPVPVQQNAGYVYGTQQPYNPYYNQQIQPVQAGGYAPVQGYPPQYPPYQAQQQYNDQAGQGYRPAPVQPQQYAAQQVQPVQPVQKPKPVYIYCGSCGARQKQGTRYCMFCGTKMQQNET